MYIYVLYDTSARALLIRVACSRPPSVSTPCTCSWRWCSQKLETLHSLHWLPWRLCSHSPLPPLSLPRLFGRRLCSQRPLLPQFLQARRLLLCSQMFEPPHSLHSFFLQLCGHLTDRNISLEPPIHLDPATIFFSTSTQPPIFENASVEALPVICFSRETYYWKGLFASFNMCVESIDYSYTLSHST